MKTLFAHLTLGFSHHPENLATEALAFMLTSSPTAARALDRRFAAAGVPIPADLRWQTQETVDDNGRPDLVGRDAVDVHRVIIEAKFWAGFTEKQPLSYLKQLLPGGILCVVGPAKRHSLLVGELERRIVDGGLNFKVLSNATDATVISVDDRTLIVMSWRIIVDAITDAAERAGERVLAENARQLQGLCDVQDSQAFLPLSSDELTAHGTYRRIIQFGDLVDELADRLGPEARKGLRPVAGNGFYGRYLRLRQVGVLLLSDIRKWTKYASTPLWLSVQGPTFSEPGPSESALARLANSEGRVFRAGDGFPAVALFVPAGVEKNAVLDSLFAQMMEVGDAIAHLAPKSVDEAQAVPHNDSPIAVEPS